MSENKYEYDDEIDLVDYIQVLIKRKNFIIAITLCCAFIGALYMWTNKTYESQTLLLLSLKVEQSENLQETLSGTPGTQLVIPTLSAETYEILATTSDLNRTLHDSLRSTQKDTTHVPPYGLKAELIQKTNNSPSQLMAFKVTSPNPNVPVKVVNTWTRLFVKQNRGLSSGVAKSYHDWVTKQYNTADTNLAKTEKAIQELDLTYNDLSILKNESTIKNSELESSLKSYQSLEVLLQSKKRERDHLKNLLNQLEIDNMWIGYLSKDQLPPQQQTLATPSSIRRNLILLMYDLTGLEKDSISVFQQSQKSQQEHTNYAKNKILNLNQDTQIDLIRKRFENLTTTLNAHQLELPDLKHKIQDIDIELAIYNQALGTEKPLLVLSKAIADDALWNQVAQKSNVSEEKQKNLTRYRLYTEQVNPLYQQLWAHKTDLQIKKNLYEQRYGLLDNQIPIIKNELLMTQHQLDSLEIIEQDLTQHLSTKHFFETKQLNLKKSPILNALQRQHQAFEDHRVFYLQNKQQFEILQREIQRIQKDVEFEENRFKNWSEEIQRNFEVLDALQTKRAQLIKKAEIYAETFQRFSRLLEEARISQEQAAGDIQVISWASEAQPKSTLKYLIIIILTGGMGSVFLSFILEYIQKAQTRLTETKL